MNFLIDAEAAADALREEGFHCTTLKSKGGFLKNESRTFLMDIFPDGHSGKARGSVPRRVERSL
jgi:uncharacterized protein YaaQ